ncbi:MAG: NTPase [Spirochaetes bacterium ADurb.Bin110]|nr:MAG: NTPase [Spirochaetes bacterium ADurb.Bin110]
MKIFLISGPRGSGKTSFCNALIKAAKERGIVCRGCMEISQRDENWIPYRISLYDVSNGETFLAASRPIGKRDVPFEFSPDAFAHIRESYIKAIKLDTISQHAHYEPDKKREICLIDEIGPLELENRSGHLCFLEFVLSTKDPGALILTVRTSLKYTLISFLANREISANHIYNLELEKLTISSACLDVLSFLE